MQSKSLFIAHGVAILVCVSTMIVGCSKSPPVAPPATKLETAEQIKLMVELLNAPQQSSLGFGIDLKPIAAEKLGELGQAAIDAGAIPELQKLSQNPKASPNAKAAAIAALAKLNAAAAP